MPDTESIDLEHAGLLDADSIPNANQSHSCFSCGESMTGVYCYACGNKNDNYRRSIWSLGVELFSSLTAFEGRIWRSLRSLIFKPGQMAREFSDGARQKWTSPIRMYLATSLLLFGYVALSGTQLVAFGTKEKPNSVFKAEADDKRFTPQVFFLERKSKIRELVSDDAISAFEQDMANIINNDENKTLEALEKELTATRNTLQGFDFQIEDANFRYAKPGLVAARNAVRERISSLENKIREKQEAPETTSSQSTPLEIQPETETNDMLGEDIEDIIDNVKNDVQDEGTSMNIVGISGEKFTLDSAGMRQAISIAIRKPERLNAPISKWLPRIMFVMMPFSMLIGAIFIRGREQAMLYDHLVHAAYIHAFSFLLLFVFILLVQFTSIPALLGIYSLILLIYLPLSTKHMFGRGWFKTFLTSYGVGCIYTFNMMVILTLLITIGLIDIAKDVAIQTPS